MGERIHKLRKDKGLTLEYIGKTTGVAKSTVRKWESGDIASIRSVNLQRLADVLGTTIEYLLEGTTNNLIYKNIEPLPDTRPIPVVGRIACGTPTLASENVEGYAELDARVHADFALRCVGDSMVNAHIFDGDLVFIQKQPDVENGEIAAVVIDEEATLKRVYKYPNRIELRPENPLFPVLQYEGADLEQVRIIGKAVYFLGTVR
jgi:repressor LexA